MSCIHYLYIVLYILYKHIYIEKRFLLAKKTYTQTYQSCFHPAGRDVWGRVCRGSRPPDRHSKDAISRQDSESREEETEEGTEEVGKK